ncbi:LLM class flavin-dependent oxidoreductase [Williamsia muralis]|uniref:FMN-dependent oxidoreductase (Nitrilotriacetate monooxygenase family) n=1 Tax=Williamsia marianensis TaxID=85044 RepID=A0A315S3I8_WILMA|nr:MULTISPECIES: LLM class flavin-dependent oxidoreductase [Williamsia]PVY28108.1 FMN-dependent oxidoreductase (nitrilotriacetate monooxygenase family) [Williamsia marianensis]RKR94282.1 FMN-dependent oxidoreductase (nitrilotriacetate monooxygenase family) [Williamsia muralis]
MTRTLHLNAFLMGVGHHEAAWRHPRTSEHEVLDVAHFVRLGQIAERGKLDSVFFADGLAVGPNIRRNTQAIFEPITLLSAIAGGTSKVGLIATASTGYNHPYTLARAFASLEHISGGRAGWNIVTSGQEQEALNFGYDSIPDHAGRYRRAQEFVDVVNRLWGSWEDDAVVLDVDNAIFADPERVHPINHVGEAFRVRGPLNSPRSPQGRPVLVQAGSSEDGKDLAARYAEVVFTAQRTIAEGQDFYRDLKRRLPRYGRGAEELQILPGIVPFIGSTEQEARDLEREFTDLISPDYALGQLSNFFNVDLTGLPLDSRLPPLPPESEIQGHKSRSTLVRQLAASEDLTIRELIGRLGGGRGHRTITGTPEQIADDLIAWVDAGAADGFNVMPPYLPGGLEDFVDHVVPILQARGRFRDDYTASTLRGHYGIELPAGSVEKEPAAASA